MFVSAREAAPVQLPAVQVDAAKPGELCPHRPQGEAPEHEAAESGILWAPSLQLCPCVQAESSLVAMDFSGKAGGRVIQNPTEAQTVGMEEGQAWRVRLEGFSGGRCSGVKMWD